MHVCSKFSVTIQTICDSFQPISPHSLVICVCKPHVCGSVDCVMGLYSLPFVYMTYSCWAVGEYSLLWGYTHFHYSCWAVDEYSLLWGGILTSIGVHDVFLLGCGQSQAEHGQHKVSEHLGFSWRWQRPVGTESSVGDQRPNRQDYIGLYFLRNRQ